MPKGVSAAEKYAQGPRPLCECHGVEMLWMKNARRSLGGYWTCAERRRELDRHYYNTPGTYAYNLIHGIGEAREKYLKKQEKLRSDPVYRRKHTIYKMRRYYRQKKERYGNQGLTFGDHGEEVSQGTDRAIA